MKLRFVKAVAFAVATLAISSVTRAGDVELYSVLYPEGKEIDIDFTSTKAAPPAALSASVETEKGQAKIEISYKGMRPAILFGGEITTYVVWAVTSDGATENLGELLVREPNGKGDFQTGQKSFAIVITAEIFPGKRKPAERLLFFSIQPKEKGAKATAFRFSNWGVLGQAENESIAGLEYKGKDPVDLVQARKVYALAKNYGAADYDPTRMDQAKLTMTQAENLAKGGDEKGLTEFSRRTVALCSEAIRAAATKKAAEQAAADDARRKAEVSKLKTDADRAAADAERSSLEAARVSAQLAEVEKQRALLAEETRTLGAEKAKVEKERDELKARLEGALGQVSSTKTTARGLVVNLGDILFDSGKSTLKPAAQQNVAKLAGILLMIPTMNARIEGHTDSMGKEPTNQKLSEARAKAVADLLGKHGIAKERISFQGYGSKIAADDNKTKEGRAQNRRVEVVVAEGAIAAAEAPAPAGK